MNRSSASLVTTLARVARPWSLIGGILLYALGGGIAVYLGSQIDWPVYWIGQAGVTMLQLSSYFLSEYFNRAGQPPFETRPPRRGQHPPDNITPDTENPELQAVEAEVPRGVFLQIAAATLTVGAVTAVLLIAEQKMPPVVILFFGLALLLALAYAVPPLRLVSSGYGELALTILSANLFPAIAFLLQYGDLHRLLATLTFPLTFLYLASTLALSLQGYYHNIQENRQTMLTRLGWQRGMSLHNALIALAYVVLAISVIAKLLPWRLAFPGFLSLPVAIFEIWQMNSIANGAKPRWRLLAYTALALVGFTVYFINIALWIG